MKLIYAGLEKNDDPSRETRDMVTQFADSSSVQQPHSADALNLKAVLENWQELIGDRNLNDLPYKIETNGFGQIVMSPANRRHSRYQGIIIGWLYALKTSGEVYPECPVATPEGVKVPDAAWISDARLAVETDPSIFTLAPEVCIEVLSPSNRKLEIEQKKTLYFQQGAQEVWECDDSGTMTFFTVTAEIEQSVLFPKFPKQL